MTKIILSEKQKTDTQFIMLKRFFDLAKEQEYFDWANDLLQADIFLHELAMITSFQYTEPNIFYADDLNENLTSVFRQLGFDDIENEEQAYNDLISLYCQKILNKQLDFVEGLEEIHWIAYDYFHGYVNVWFFLFDELPRKQSDDLYQTKVLSVMQDFINHHQSNTIDKFYQKNQTIPQTATPKQTIFNKFSNVMGKKQCNG